MLTPLLPSSPLPSTQLTVTRSAASAASEVVIPPSAAGPIQLMVRRWWPMAAAGIGGGLLLDGLGHLLHLPLVSAAATAAGLVVLWSWRRPSRFQLGPSSTDSAGWMQRLERLQHQFDSLDSSGSGAEDRSRQLDHQRGQLERQGLHLAVVGSVPDDQLWRQQLSSALQGGSALTLHWSRPLPTATPNWQWSEPFSSSDLLLFCVKPPLTASHLRWLEALPTGLPVLLLLELVPCHDAALVTAELHAQLPPALNADLVSWCQSSDLQDVLAPLARRWGLEAASLRRQRQQRCLAQLHSAWQAELESLRRCHYQTLQQRTQWIVAAGVVAAPLPSLDLLILAVANGLMVKEMAALWDCPWSPEQLRATALELARACVSLGVVEWTSQALAGLIKWHGATWLLGSAVQALSAAYLTRVVGRAMADTLARSVGVKEPDLERIRREAPLLVSQAAETERLDWQAFLQQGRQWLAQQASVPAQVTPT